MSTKQEYIEFADRFLVQAGESTHSESALLRDQLVESLQAAKAIILHPNCKVAGSLEALDSIGTALRAAGVKP